MNPEQLSHVIEQFQLLFLAHLTRGADKRSIVVKGGCNLRFFHRSIRYSEDMDLDVAGIEEHALRDRVRNILASRPFAQVLEARGIGIEHVTEHKQTPTVQRWKFGLTSARHGQPLPTKIEFSRRGLDEGVEFGSLDPAIIARHRLTPFMVSHYGAAAALEQKVRALAHRTETQARDVFDVHHLIAIRRALSALRAISRDDPAAGPRQGVQHRLRDLQEPGAGLPRRRRAAPLRVRRCVGHRGARSARSARWGPGVRLVDALASLGGLEDPIFETGDAAVRLVFPTPTRAPHWPGWQRRAIWSACGAGSGRFRAAWIRSPCRPG